MRIPENETGLPLVEAIEAATGRRVHLFAAIRWCQSRNRYGSKLESWFIGGRRVTSVERVRAHNERTTAAADPDLRVATSTQRNRVHKDATNELDREFASSR